jgi:hypothetical protein
LSQGAKANGYPTDLWTLARAAEVIQRVSGVRYHPGHVWYLLHDRLNWSRQRPARRATERNEAAMSFTSDDPDYRGMFAEILAGRGDCEAAIQAQRAAAAYELLLARCLMPLAGLLVAVRSGSTFKRRCSPSVAESSRASTHARQRARQGPPARRSPGHPMS